MINLKSGIIFLLKLKFCFFILLIFTQSLICAGLTLGTVKYLSADDCIAEEFLIEIAKEIDNARERSRFASQRPVFITANHIVPTIRPYLCALSSVGDVAMIIPKGNSPSELVDIDLRKIYGEAYKMRKEGDLYNAIMTRTMLDSPDKVLAVLADIQKQYADRPIIIIDIGGYFTEVLKISQITLDQHKINLVGIVEDTENGHQKYEAVLEAKQNNIPVYSVARSELKKTEDYCVGKSIVEATDTLFRIKKHTIPERMQTAGVMGYGKIGSSIAEHLRRKNIHVYVSEIIPLRAQLALSNDHNVVFDSATPKDGYKKLFPKTNIIFGATGKNGLSIADLKEWIKYHKVIYLSSCTSAVDEYAFNPADLEEDDYFKLHRSDKQILEFTVAEDPSKKVVFFRGGDAVNFCFGGVNGPYIYSVQAALLTAASKLFQANTVPQVVAKPTQQQVPTNPILLRKLKNESVGGIIPQRQLYSSQQSTAQSVVGAAIIKRELFKLDATDETNISQKFLEHFTEKKLSRDF